MSPIFLRLKGCDDDAIEQIAKSAQEEVLPKQTGLTCSSFFLLTCPSSVKYVGLKKEIVSHPFHPPEKTPCQPASLPSAGEQLSAPPCAGKGCGHRDQEPTSCLMSSIRVYVNPGF